MSEIEELLNMGESFLQRNDKIGALRMFERALKIALDNVDMMYGAIAHLEIGKIMLEKKQFKLAGDNFKWASLLFKKSGDTKSYGNALFHLGKTYYLQGKYRKSRKPLESAYKNINEEEFPVICSELHYYLGSVYMDIFYLDRAFEHLNKAQKLFQKTKNRKGAADAFFNQGNLFYKAGDFNVAREYFERSLIIYGEIQRDTEIAEACLKLGAILTKDKNYEGAEKLFKSAFDKFQQNGKILKSADTALLLGEFYIKLEKWNEAEEILEKAIALYRDLDTPQKLADTFYNMTLVLKQKGQNKKEYKNLLNALEHYMLADSYEDGIKILEELGQLCVRDGNLKEARHYFLEAIDLSKNMDINIELSQIKKSIEKINRKLKKIDDIALHNKIKGIIDLKFI